jgi:hypothetical protein
VTLLIVMPAACLLAVAAVVALCLARAAAAGDAQLTHVPPAEPGAVSPLAAPGHAEAFGLWDAECELAGLVWDVPENGKPVRR